MLKCTAVIPRDGYNETRKLNVPVLPQIGDEVTYSGVVNESFIVKSFEYIIYPHTGDCTAIIVNLEEKDV